jgi:extracellular factor (EF) 3-hydroxypalmitic acid methyl ester biosynthesis protein
MTNALKVDDPDSGGDERAQRFRSPRYRTTELNMGRLEALFEHGGGQFAGEVVDFSAAGLALSVDDARGTALFLAGDRISSLRVCRGDTQFFDGPATLRSVRPHEEAGKLLLGVCFERGTLEMRKLYDLDTRVEAERHFASSFGELDALHGIAPKFKAWVGDVGYALDGLRERLLADEQRIARFDRLTRETAAKEIVDVVFAKLRPYMAASLAELHELVGGLDEGQHQVHRRYFQRHLLAKFIDESPFFHRCYTKPLGYAGDYEMMNMIYGDHRQGATLYSQAVNMFGLDTTGARAVASRAPFVAGLVAELARRRPLTRLASLACGPAREISTLLKTNALDDATVTLLDVEPLAIRYCEKVLLPELRESGRNTRIQFIRESVRQIIRQRRLDAVLERQDVIVSMGLFDYFGDDLFRHLLRRLYDLLQPDGHLIIGNFDYTNDSRYLMEYAMDWPLQYRTADDLRALAAVLPAEAEVEVVAEPMRVNLFLQIRKP